MSGAADKLHINPKKKSLPIECDEQALLDVVNFKKDGRAIPAETRSHPKLPAVFRSYLPIPVSEI